MAKPKGKKSPEKKAAVTKFAKNKKRSWQHIQHPDVEEYLEDQRQDERLGKISTKADEQLFTIDTVGVDPKEVWTRKSIRVDKSSTGPLIEFESLKCFNLLKPHTQVPDPLIKRNRVKLPGEGKSAAMLLKDARRLNNKRKPVQPSKQEITDPWAYEVPKTVLDNEWVPENVRRHNLRPRIAPPPIKYKSSELPAIPTPHPGYSYNPTFDDHQNLLKMAVTKELAQQRKERNLIKATSALKCDTVEVKEESSSEEEADEEEPEDKKYKKNEAKPKTRQGKRKERVEKEKTRDQRSKKEDSARLNEVFRIKTIQKEIKAAEESSKARLEKLVKKKVHQGKFGQKELSKFKFEEIPANPALGEELQGSLVGVPSNNNLLLDRFKSFQQRNILEPRLRNHNKRKYKLKKFLRTADKMPWEKTGVWNDIKLN